MSNDNIFNPHNIDPEELMLVNDKIRNIKAEINDLKEQKALCHDRERINRYDRYIEIEAEKLARFIQERQYIMGRGFKD
jgi:hypothetical protein